jgi:hypothetical protein
MNGRGWDWVFRGQSNDRLELSTKFERDAKKYRCDDTYWFRNREKYILWDFQRRAHQYIKILPKLENLIEWLSLLQHHGGATRLLDFTWSCYVAAFFAVETSETDSIIWAVNIKKLIEQLKNINDSKITEKEHAWEDIIERNNQWANGIIKDRKNDNLVLLVEPFQQHERISIQQGLFLFPGNIEESFEFNISSVFKFDFKELSDNNASNIVFSRNDKFDFSDISIIKIVIPFGLHSEVLMKLYNMNITAATLFPGLDGFARSLSYRFRELDYFLNRKG